MPHSSTRIVADVGNSRLKLGQIGPDGLLAKRVAVPLDNHAAWERVYADWGLCSRDSWAISTVNPSAAMRLRSFLDRERVEAIRWYESAAAVPVAHRLPHPEKAGADRALAVLGALKVAPSGLAGLVISCGTAMTVERIAADGVWEGGAIAPGLGLAAGSLNQRTAQLPRVEVKEAPEFWGNSTEPAIAAGVFWGAVGSLRELIARQQDVPRDWVFWTGGDAGRLAFHVEGEGARFFPDLVLFGLSQLDGVEK